MNLESTIDQLVETIPALRQENAVLRAALARLESEITLQNDDNQRLRVELDKTRSDLKWTAYELDQCRARARLYHSALADVMGADEAAAVAALNEGEG